MSRTQGRLDSDTGYEDGVIDLSAGSFSAFGGTTALTRTAKGNVSWQQSASQTCQYISDLRGMLFRTGLRDYTQNAFGAGGVSDNPHGAGSGYRFGSPTTQSTANATAKGPGVAVNIAVKYSALFTVGRGVLIDTGASQEYQIVTALPDATHITVAQLLNNHTSVFTITQGQFTTSAGQSGPSVGNATATQFNAVTSRPKGVNIRGAEIRYLVTAANLTSLSVGLSETVYKNATALAITDILAPSTTPYAVAVAATPYVVPVVINSGYLTDDLASYLLEIIGITPTSSVLNFYGVTLYVTYNFN